MDNMIETIKGAIDSLGTTTYGGSWDSALVEGINGERYHAIINDNDVVVRADDDNRHSSWLCDYLELVSPVNVLKLIAQLEAAQKENANDNKLKYIRRLEAEKQTEANTINLQRRVNLELMSENAGLKQRIDELEIHLKGVNAANRVLSAALDAASERLLKPVEFPDCDIGAVSHMAHWYSEKQCEAWVAGVEFSKKQIKAAGFTVEGE